MKPLTRNAALAISILTMLWACGTDDKPTYDTSGGAPGAGEGGSPSSAGESQGGSSAGAPAEPTGGQLTSAGAGGAGGEIGANTGGSAGAEAGGAGGIPTAEAGSAGDGGHDGVVSEACPAQVTYIPTETQGLNKLSVFTCELADCFGNQDLPLTIFCDNTGDNDPNVDCRITLRQLTVEARLDTRAHLVTMRVSQRYLAEPFVTDRICVDSQALKQLKLQWVFDAVPGPLDEKGCPTYHWMYGNKVVGTAIQTSGLAGAVLVPMLTCTADQALDGVNGYQPFVTVMRTL